MKNEDYAVLPVDLLTHIDDWRAACEIARDTFYEFPDPLTGEYDRSYWVKQLKTLDNIEKSLEGASHFHVSEIKDTHLKRTNIAHMEGATKKSDKES